MEEVTVVETVVADYYDLCVFDEDCPPYVNCHDIEIDYGAVIIGDAMCTVACGSDFDRPLDGICLGAAIGSPLCYQPCLDDFDCPILMQGMATRNLGNRPFLLIERAGSE